MDEEIWKSIPDFEGYLVSSYGRVKSFKVDTVNGKILKLNTDKSGRRSIVFYKPTVKRVFIHRLVYTMFFENIPSEAVIDHVDRNPSNNRIGNLRIATNSQNRMNCGPAIKNALGLKGIRRRQNKYKVQISVNRKAIFLGAFSSLIEAVNCYNTAALKYFGEYASLNKLPEKDIVLKVPIKSSRNASTGYRCVFKDKRDDTYSCKVFVNKKSYHLGTFDTPEIPAQLYNIYAKLVYGDNAILNEVL